MIKSDINLLPRKKKVPAKIILGIPAGILLLAVICALGIMAPSLALGAQQAKLNVLQQQLSTYSQVETNYQQKVGAYSTIQEQQKNYNDFVSNDKQTLDMLNKINAIKPSTITLLSEKFDIDRIILSGYGTTDIEIARFEIELRKLGLFSDILLSSITGPDNQRSYSYTLMYKADSSQASSAASSKEGSASK